MIILTNDQNNNFDNEQYRDAYNRLWIKELCDYCP